MKSDSPPSEGGAESDVAPTSRARRFALPAILALVALANLPKLDNGFVYDDVRVIVDSEFIHDPANIPDAFLHHTLIATGDADTRAVDTYRPITLLTFFWDAAISGRDPLGYHLTNLFLHLICVALVFVIARRVLNGHAWAAFAATYFGLSPWLAEAHVWINGRSDPTCTAFGLGALLLFDQARGRAPGPRTLRRVAAAGLFLLGLASKEVLLLFLPAFLLWPPGETESARIGERLRATWPFFAAAALYLVVRQSALAGVRAIGDGQQASLALGRLPVLLLDGVWKLLVPVPPYMRSMAEDYGRLSGPLLVGAALAVVAAAVLLVRYRRSSPVVTFGAVIYAATLAPAAVIATMSWGGFGRYLYLPAVGVALALSAALERGLGSGLLTPRARRLSTIGLAGYLAALGVVFVTTLDTFHDQEALYTAAIEGAPDNALGYSLLASDREREERFADAQVLYERALELDPSRPKYALALAGVHLARGDEAGARAIAEAALGRVPEAEGGAFHAIIIGSVLTRDPELATRHLVTCLTHQPELSSCRRWARLLSTHPDLAPRYGPLLEQAAEASPAFRRALTAVEEAPPELP